MKKILCTLLTVMTFGASAGVSDDVRQTLEENLKYSQQENMDGMMSTIHRSSPNYMATGQAMNQLFPAYDLKYSLISYNFVGEEGGYAYIRIVQRTEKVAGPEFNNNELEALMIFKQENGKWKLWSQANLNIKFL